MSAGSGFSNLSGPLLAIVGSLHNVWRSAPLAPAAIAFTVGATAGGREKLGVELQEGAKCFWSDYFG